MNVAYMSLSRHECDIHVVRPEAGTRWNESGVEAGAGRAGSGGGRDWERGGRDWERGGRDWKRGRVGCESWAVSSEADLVFVGGKVRTPGHPSGFAEAVAVRGGMIQ